MGVVRRTNIFKLSILPQQPSSQVARIVACRQPLPRDFQNTLFFNLFTSPCLDVGKIFPGGSKSCEISFYPFETKKATCFC